MKLAYDFHIHTAASPCADNSMSPNNIVNMSLLKGLDAIAITDHNTCSNIYPVMQVAKDKDITIIPGIEIETSEEIHVIALFKDLDMALEIEKLVQMKLPNLENKKEIFGEQILYNSNDEQIGEIDRLLLTSTKLSIYEIVKMVNLYEGVCYPAHIDRCSYSIITNLGIIPSDLEIENIEIAQKSNIEKFSKQYPNLNIIKSSDAHYLENILERESYLEVEKNTPSNWIKHLKQKTW